MPGPHPWLLWVVWALCPPIHPFTCYQPHVSLGTGQAACTVHSGKASAPLALNLKVGCVILSNLCDFSEPQFTHL